MLNDFKLLQIIEKVCHNPKKYTRKGTFDEIASVLEKRGKTAIEGKFYYHSVFTPFLESLIEKNNYKIGVGLREIPKLYSSDEEAIKSLPNLYEEYIKSL